MNPFAAIPYRLLASAAEELDQPEVAIKALETLLKLQPLNPAELHFQVARLRKTSEPALAKRHLLLALEDAPRYRDAHRLLLELENVALAPVVPLPGTPVGVAPAPKPASFE